MKQLLVCTVALACIATAGCDFVTTTISTGGLSVSDTKMSLAKGGADVSSRKFKKDGPIFVQFTVKGIKQSDDDQVWIQQDLLLVGPDGKEVLKKENMLDMHEKAPKGTNLGNFSNTIDLPNNAVVGQYKVTLSVRDKVSGGTATTNLAFTAE